MRFIIKRLPGFVGPNEELDAEAAQSPEVVTLMPNKIIKRKLAGDNNDQTLKVYRCINSNSAATATAVKAGLVETTANVDSVDITAKPDPVDTIGKADTTAKANSVVTVKVNCAGRTKLWHATIRGNPLVGTVLSMPNGLVGHIVSASHSKDNEVQDSVLDIDMNVQTRMPHQLEEWTCDYVQTSEEPVSKKENKD